MRSRAETATRNRPLLHCAIALWVPVCALACYWQVTIALAGDNLGWLYSIEWPVFGIFGIVVWWNLVHDDPDAVGARAIRTGRARPARHTDRDREMTTRPAEEGPELARYNDYLTALRVRDEERNRS